MHVEADDQHADAVHHVVEVQAKSGEVPADWHSLLPNSSLEISWVASLSIGCRKRSRLQNSGRTKQNSYEGEIRVP